MTRALSTVSSERCTKKISLAPIGPTAEEQSTGERKRSCMLAWKAMPGSGERFSCDRGKEAA